MIRVLAILALVAVSALAVAPSASAETVRVGPCEVDGCVVVCVEVHEPCAWDGKVCVLVSFQRFCSAVIEP